MWFVKLLGGWFPFITKPFGEWLGKIIWVVGIVLLISLATNVWDKFFPPTPDTQIEMIETYYAEPQRDVAGIGCNLWRVYLKTGVKPK